MPSTLDLEACFGSYQLKMAILWDPGRVPLSSWCVSFEKNLPPEVRLAPILLTFQKVLKTWSFAQKEISEAWLADVILWFLPLAIVWFYIVISVLIFLHQPELWKGRWPCKPKQRNNMAIDLNEECSGAKDDIDVGWGVVKVQWAGGFLHRVIFQSSQTGKSCRAQLLDFFPKSFQAVVIGDTSRCVRLCVT